MFNMESRHLLNLSVQNALDFIPESLKLKLFPEEHAPGSPQKSAPFAVLLGAIAHIATVYYIPRLRLSQNPPSAPDFSFCTQVKVH